MVYLISIPSTCMLDGHKWPIVVCQTFYAGLVPKTHSPQMRCSGNLTLLGARIHLSISLRVASLLVVENKRVHLSVFVYASPNWYEFVAGQFALEFTKSIVCVCMYSIHGLVGLFVLPRVLEKGTCFP